MQIVDGNDSNFRYKSNYFALHEKKEEKNRLIGQGLGKLFQWLHMIDCCI